MAAAIFFALYIHSRRDIAAAFLEISRLAPRDSRKSRVTRE